jgi:hypothetical protein
LWWRGDWRGLLTAIGFAAALNLGLVTSFLWPQSLPSSVVGGGWVAILVLWLASAWQGRRYLPEVCGTVGNRENEDLFIRAQGEYLKGHWYEAETLCRQLLQKSEMDVETRLMLATLCRRTGRMEDADRELAKLEQMDGAEKWALETARERRLLTFAESEMLDGEQREEDNGVLSVQ